AQAHEARPEELAAQQVRRQEVEPAPLDLHRVPPGLQWSACRGMRLGLGARTPAATRAPDPLECIPHARVQTDFSARARDRGCPEGSGGTAETHVLRGGRIA